MSPNLSWRKQLLWELNGDTKISSRLVTDKINAEQNELSAPCARKSEECDVKMFWKFGYPNSPQKQLPTLVLETNKWLSQAAICEKHFSHFSQFFTWPLLREVVQKHLFIPTWKLGRQNIFLFSGFLEERFQFTWGPGVQAFMPLNLGRKLKATNMLKYVKTFLTVYKNAKIYRYLTWPWGNIVPKSFMYMSHLFQQSSNVKKSTNIALKKDHYNIWYNIEGWKRSSYIAFWAFLSAW